MRQIMVTVSIRLQHMWYCTMITDILSILVFCSSHYLSNIFNMQPKHQV